jgi:hypothetical protein
MGSLGRVVVVHSVLPSKLTGEVSSVFASRGIGHVPHGIDDPVAAGVAAASDSEAVALIGPFRSREVAETVEVTGPAGLPLIAPMATWAGVTRSDEPGCEDDPADHRGTVFRLLARDTEVALRIAADVRAAGQRAFVVAGEHEYGVQLEGQLRLACLPSVSEPEEADLVVLCGLLGEPEIGHARALAPLPVIAFDGVQGGDLGAGRDVRVALPFAPANDLAADELFAGIGQARLAGELVTAALRDGAHDRATMLVKLRESGRFDEHGDPVEPDIWLWRVSAGCKVQPERPLSAAP